jgi:hypothetical protein
MRWRLYMVGRNLRVLGATPRYLSSGSSDTQYSATSPTDVAWGGGGGAMSGDLTRRGVRIRETGRGPVVVVI